MARHPFTLGFTAVLLGTAAGCAAPRVDAPAGDVPLMTLAAQGVQLYECRAAAGAAPAWAFVAPEADLFDAGGRRVGRHGAGPTWTHGDGSGFTGAVRTRADAPRADAIPWLLLAATPKGPEGTFSGVSSVQRIHTVGGLPPADGCAAATLGSRVGMAYRADYVLFVPAGSPARAARAAVP